MIAIYTPEVHLNRLSYVATHLFNHILGSEYLIISDKKQFLSLETTLRINYSEENLNSGLQIIPHGLLFESDLKEIKELHPSSWQGYFTFFSNSGGDIPFDVFSASFYLLTLYEELFSEKTDKHGRFPHTESLLFQHNSLDIPVVDRWAYLLKEAWEKQGCNTEVLGLRKFKLINTFDIDSPYRYRNRGALRSLGGLTKDLFTLRIGRVISRAATALHLKEDPYFEALLRIEKIQQDIDRPYHLFILMGEGSRYDRSTLLPPVRYYDYLKGLENVTIGIHPSYNTLRNMKLLAKERAELEAVLGYRVYDTRQHFLRMQTPETFEELALAGLKDDYTLAFASACGFRSGTAIPYRFYDLHKEIETELTLHPTVMMDSTLIFHRKVKPEEGMKQIKHLIDQCKASGGDYLALWHNSNLAGSPERNPWLDLFIETTKYGISIEN